MILAAVTMKEKKKKKEKKFQTLKNDEVILI
jgi:hypothetical protein